MGRKHALGTHSVHVILTNRLPAQPSEPFGEQFQSKQTGMALVHMEVIEVSIAEGAEHFHATHPQQHLLTQPIPGVTAIQDVGQGAIPGGVLYQVGVQEIHRHREAAQTLHLVAPGLEMDGASFHEDGSPYRHGLQNSRQTRRPVPRAASPGYPAPGENTPGDAAASPPLEEF
jgi:hypothetical protein